MSIVRVKVSEVIVGDRIRNYTGDLESLCKSMGKIGLLHPILVDEENHLIAGFRRLEAARSLGWESIDALQTEAKGKKETLWAELEENTTRVDFSQEELKRGEELLSLYEKKSFWTRLWQWLCNLMRKRKVDPTSDWEI